MGAEGPEDPVISVSKFYIEELSYSPTTWGKASKANPDEE
jgi:hypothetical protein